jgi:salicylate hydroxylase
MRQKQLSVAIIGGGIGGLSAALSLLRAGVDVHVYERAQAIHEVGAGIAISPNAVRILYRNGLEKALDRVGVRTQAWHYHRWQDGRTLYRSQIAGPMEAAFGAPLYHVHRADLVMAMMEAIPPEHVHVGHKCTTFTDHGDFIEAEFENGAHIQADALVGADGIHSVVREKLFGPAVPNFTGLVAYRGLIPTKRLAHLHLEPEAHAWMGPGSHLVHYFVKNKQMINFVSIVEQESWTKESWTEPGRMSDVLAVYKGWAPQLLSVLEAFDETFVSAVFDRKPMGCWSVGRVTLLGDAGHPMLPTKAQGSAQAIEDGATLALLMAQADAQNVADVFRKYEAIRMARVNRVQNEAGDNRSRFHLPDGPEQQRRDAEWARSGADFSPQTAAWLFGYDAEKPELVQMG